MNTGASGATFTVYDGTDANGVVICVIDASTKSSHAYGVIAAKGLFAVLASGNADVTVGFD